MLGYLSVNRNMVGKVMTPSQVEKAQEMARNWKPKIMKTKSLFIKL
jgi:hypothetical protein